MKTKNNNNNKMINKIVNKMINKIVNMMNQIHRWTLVLEPASNQIAYSSHMTENMPWQLKRSKKHCVYTYTTCFTSLFFLTELL